VEYEGLFPNIATVHNSPENQARVSSRWRGCIEDRRRTAYKVQLLRIVMKFKPQGRLKMPRSRYHTVRHKESETDNCAFDFTLEKKKEIFVVTEAPSEARLGG